MEWFRMFPQHQEEKDPKNTTDRNELILTIKSQTSFTDFPLMSIPLISRISSPSWSSPLRSAIPPFTIRPIRTASPSLRTVAPWKNTRDLITGGPRDCLRLRVPNGNLLSKQSRQAAEGLNQTTFECPEDFSFRGKISRHEKCIKSTKPPQHQSLARQSQGKLFRSVKVKGPWKNGVWAVGGNSLGGIKGKFLWGN